MTINHSPDADNGAALRTVLTHLREVFAYLYDDPLSAKRVADDALVPTGGVNFQTGIVNVWEQIFAVAERVERIEQLLKIAAREFGPNRRLAQAQAAYAALLAPAPAVSARDVRVVDGGPAAVSSEIRQRYALLIGIRDYNDQNFRALPNTVSDVVALGKVLRAAGYSVRVMHSDQSDPLLKPTRANIWGELGNLLNNKGTGDLLLVHFGGHGDVENGKAYLLAEETRRFAYANTAIDLEQFTGALADAPAQARILFLDACHSGIARSSGGMDPEFERRLYREATGMATLAACRQQELAYEHDSAPHGAFTYFLLEGLRGAARPAGHRLISFKQLDDFVTGQVKQWAFLQNRQQWPNAKTALVGDPALVELVDE